MAAPPFPVIPSPLLAGFGFLPRSYARLPAAGVADYFDSRDYFDALQYYHAGQTIYVPICEASRLTKLFYCWLRQNRIFWGIIILSAEQNAKTPHK